MDNRSMQMKLGIGAMATAAFLLLIAIPFWVSSPSNVPNIVLSPLFWPNILAVLTGFTGAGLLFMSLRQPRAKQPVHSDVDDKLAAFSRLGVLAVIMGVTLYAMPRLGLVWTAMLVFASVAFLIRTNHPKTALICAVALPLFLYLFFAHVAGVAIPQGHYVRLP